MINLPERALSIRQPWAWAILNAGKDVENRTVRWKYRGPICIHASLYKPKTSDNEDCLSVMDQIYGNLTQREMVNRQGRMASMHNSNESVRGGIIGIAEIVECIDQSESPWFCGPFGLVLKNVQPVPFIPVRGALGLFRWKSNLSGAST